jgi:hypothetical protein
VGVALEAYEEWWQEDQGRSTVQVFGTGFLCSMSARDSFCGLLFTNAVSECWERSAFAARDQMTVSERKKANYALGYGGLRSN